MRQAMWLLLAAFALLPCCLVAKDPEVDMSATQIIQHWGYHAEIYSVTTDDGYVLELHRIPYGRDGPGSGCRPVIFMQHGFECSSTNWLVNLPAESAGYIFADAGFDVWMGNMRGNTYSKAHTTLDPSDEKFWEFSWDEMVQHDLSAMIDKVINVTGQQSIYYMGHSQGTLTMFSKLSSDANFGSKIKKFFALAPVGTVAHLKGLFRVVADLFLPEFKLWVQLFGSGEFLPNNWVMKFLAETICGIHASEGLCANFMFLISGPESNQFNKTREDVYVSHTPAGTSTQNVIHWAQMVKSGIVARYDYGSAKENQQHYGSSKPPAYDFETIKTDMYLYWSPDDWVADADDVEGYLLNSLNPNYLKKNVKLPNYNHLDFIWGLNAPYDIYHPIIDLIKSEHGGQITCTAPAQ